MIIAQNFASKLFVAFVAASMLFTLAMPAKAATMEELQAQINALMAQLAAAQGSSSADSMSSKCTFTRPLTIGSQGEDVKCLQEAMTPTYFNNAGGATGYFGPVTQAAVAKWQAAVGVSPAAGYFGPLSQAKFAEMMMSDSDDEMSDDEDDEMTDDSDDSSDDEDRELSGAADLEDFEVDDAADTEIEEGSEDQEIAEITVQFENGDAMIDRLEIALLGRDETNTNTIEPWDVFESISLWVDGDMIAEEDADDESLWLDEDLGTFRFDGLDIFAGENEDVVITVAVNVQNGLETSPAEIGDWDFGVEEVRFFDADGVSDDDSTTDQLNNFARPIGVADVAEFEIREEGDEDELFIRTSTNDPDATTIELEDDEISDFIEIFAFDLDTEDSVSDIMVEGLRVDVAATEDGTTATSTIFLINDAQLVVDGEVYDDVTITNGTTGNYVFDLDDEDFVIEAGERVEVSFQVEFEALASNFEGATVIANVDTDGLSAEGAENLTVGANQLSGSAVGEEHTLRTEGAILAPSTMTAELVVNDDTDVNDNEGLFTINFKVTAFENDLYINKSAASGTTMGTAGANFIVEDTNGVQVAAGTSTASLTSTADTDGTRFRVNEGETETFTLTVEYDPTAQGFFQLQLYSLNFNVANSNPNTQQRALDESDYQTGTKSI